MSADNWTICPKCKLKAEIERDQAIEKAEDSYGKVAPDEYLLLRAAAEAEPKLEPTFREDYEIGTHPSGQFYVSYTGRCTVCGITYEHNHSGTVI